MNACPPWPPKRPSPDLSWCWGVVVVMLVDGGEAIAQIPAAHRKKLVIRSLPGLIDKTPATGAFCST